MKVCQGMGCFTLLASPCAVLPTSPVLVCARRLVWDESLTSSENYISLALNVWCHSSSGVQNELECKNAPIPTQTVHRLKITLVKAAVSSQQKLLTLSLLGALFCDSWCIVLLMLPDQNGTHWPCAFTNASNSVQHEGRRCRQRKGCQPCSIFNLLNGCTGLFD